MFHESFKITSALFFFFQDNEYVLVQVESTPHVTYRDDFDATLIVAHDRDDESDQSSLHIKYYIILTSRR
jgi:hypothetical protein